MKRSIIMLALLAAMAIPSLAAAQDGDLTRRQVASYDRFLDWHPQVERQLNRHPGLANNPRYLAAHPALQRYEATHPGFTGEVRENPREVARAERRYQHTWQDRRQDWRQRRIVNRWR